MHKLLQSALAKERGGTWMRWGFNVEEIACEKIFLWHGAQDRFVPVSLAYALAQALPHCAVTFYPHEGHLSTPGNHAEDILKTLSS